MAFPCTSLADLADYPPDSGRLEQETPARYAFWCTSETCTSRHHLEASKRTSTIKLQFIGLSPTPAKVAYPPQSILGRKLYREGKVIEQYSVIGR